MNVIVFVTQKGGAGKSTLAACLGVAAEAAGERVFLLDLDPQHSLLGWGKKRQAETPAVDSAEPAQLTAALKVLESHGFTLIILDTAGHDNPAASAAVRAADLCLIPSRPTAFDVMATRPTRDMVEKLGKPYLFVLNQCPPGHKGTRAQDGQRALEMMGVVAHPTITTRVDFQEAAVQGLGVNEINPRGKAAEEIDALWQTIKKNLVGGMTHGNRKAG